MNYARFSHPNRCPSRAMVQSTSVIVKSDDRSHRLSSLHSSAPLLQIYAISHPLPSTFHTAWPPLIVIFARFFFHLLLSFLITFAVILSLDAVDCTFQFPMHNVQLVAFCQFSVRPLFFVLLISHFRYNNFSNQCCIQFLICLLKNNGVSLAFFKHSSDNHVKHFCLQFQCNTPLFCLTKCIKYQALVILLNESSYLTWV